MNERYRPTEQETQRHRPLLEQANDVVFGKFIADIQHGANCGCGSCMGKARGAYDFYIGETTMTTDEKNKEIAALAESTLGGIIFDQAFSSPAAVDIPVTFRDERAGEDTA